MKQGWEIKKLGEVCDFQGGSQPPKSNFIFEAKKGFVRFLQIRDFGSDKNITYIPISERNKYCKEDDILLGRYGASVGKILINKAGAYNVAVMKTIPDEAVLVKMYLYFYLTSNEFQKQLLKVAIRSAQDGFSKADIFDFPIVIPNLETQKQIVSILDQAFATIDQAKTNAQKNLQNAKELFESSLQIIFTNKGKGWEEKKLKDISNVFGRGKSKHRPRGDSSLLNGKYPLIQTGDISNSNHWINSYNQTYNEKGLAQSKLWSKGTICIAIVGSNVAETAILNFDACFPDSVIGIEVNPLKANNEYVDYVLQSFKALLKEKGKGTARDNINLGTFENQKFPFPPLTEQQIIVSKLDALQVETKKLETIYTQKIADLDELKKSILQKAFAGELSLETTKTQTATAKVSVVKPKTKIVSINPTDLQAGIVSIALQRHQQKNQTHTFHHVKAEKIVHLAQSILCLELERVPCKDAAGPNDFPHSKKVESRAKKAGFYTVHKKADFYEYSEGTQMQKLIDKTYLALDEKAEKLNNLIDMIVPMTTQQAEIFATVYAGWNNLLLDNKPFTDEDIVTESRENWHKQKLNIEREKFFNAITWMREKNIIPAGIGNKVSTKIPVKK